MKPRRLITLLAAAWLGALLAVALIAAPSAFAVLDRPAAGRLVGRLFALEAPISLVLALAVVLLERWRLRLESAPVRPTAAMLMALVGLFCTVAGYYALQPMMEAARLGQGALSFGVLHGLSMGFFGLKLLAVAVLAWRS